MFDSIASAIETIRIPLSDHVQRWLSHQIITSQPGYEPGDRLNVQQIAAELGISVMPVASALKMLAAQDLVEIRPRSGTFVARPDPARVRDWCELMAHLEATSLRIVQGRIPDATLDTMRSLVEKAEQCSASEDLEGYMETDHAFHRAIGCLSANQEFHKTYLGVLHRFELAASCKSRFAAERQRSIAMHRRLLEAFGRQDLKQSECAIMEHWEQAMQGYLRYVVDGGTTE